MAYRPQTNVVPGIAAGMAHAISNATQTMAHATSLSEASASKTQRGMQVINITTTAQMVALILKSG